MSRKSRSKSGSKSGYGVPNINKQRISKKDINVILKKRWSDVSSLDLYKLYQSGLKTEVLVDNFKISLISLLNRLRFQ